MAELFSDDEGQENSEHTLTINEHYAKAFEYRKEREELERLKAKYGSDYDPDKDESTDSESAESEDEFGEELTPVVDAAILRTLARIRKKDPDIYDSNKDIFTQEQEKVSGKVPQVLDGQMRSKEKSKPITIRQANLDAMLHGSRSPSPQPLTHVQEQEILRKQTIAAFHGVVTEGDDDFLVPREKTGDERDLEEEEYRAFLEREVGELKNLVSVDGSGDEKEDKVDSSDKENDMKKKKKRKIEAGKKSKAEEDQEFLMNYILNRVWIDKSEGRVPSYQEVTSNAGQKRKNKGKAKAESQENEDANEDTDTSMLSDTSFESVASYFEASYNHRFEEPGAATIPSFPRVLQSTVRREDTKRKDARERRKQRKEEEMNKKREELKRLKALKMRELKRKLDMIGKQGGLKKNKADGKERDEDTFIDEALEELDLEGEWDPVKHDQQMASLFERGANAYEDEDEEPGDDGVKFDEDGKPIWDDDIDIGDIAMDDNVVRTSKKHNKKRNKKKKGGDDDPGGVDIDTMDADLKPTFDDEEWDGTEEMRKRKLNEYMDEIYGLEFNDLVGDMPIRFKYTKVEPQAFSLTPAEILMATDQELNEYMSVKKYAPYRQDKNRWSHNKQEKLREIKAKIMERSGGVFGGNVGYNGKNADEKPAKKRKGKKERMKLKAVAGEDEGGNANVEGGDGNASQPSINRGQNGVESKKSKKRKRVQDYEDGPIETVSNENGEKTDEGRDESSKKKKRKRNRKKLGEEATPA